MTHSKRGARSGPSKIWRALATLATLTLATAGGPAAAQGSNAPATVDVQPGDTFSAIAARYTGDARTWRKLYSPENTGLANPNLITPGMRLELVTDAAGSKYLRYKE